jgi:hypothetical protein
MKKFIPEVKEVRYIENKEQQKLTVEQEQELIENSYYFENEAWSDISVQKNYGPGHFPPKCHAHPTVFVPAPGNTLYTHTYEGIRIGRQANGSWCCEFHRSTFGGNNYEPVMPTAYRCAHQDCPSIVSRSGDFCSTHNNNNNRGSSSNTTSTQQLYNCSHYGCRIAVNVRGGYCHLHQ